MVAPTRARVIPVSPQSECLRLSIASALCTVTTGYRMRCCRWSCAMAIPQMFSVWLMVAGATPRCLAAHEYHFCGMTNAAGVAQGASHGRTRQIPPATQPHRSDFHRLGLDLRLGLVYCELGAALPRAGGVVRYPMYSHGALLGYLMGLITLIAFSSLIAIETVACRQYASAWFPGLTQAHSDNPTLLGW